MMAWESKWRSRSCARLALSSSRRCILARLMWHLERRGLGLGSTNNVHEFRHRSPQRVYQKTKGGNAASRRMGHDQTLLSLHWEGSGRGLGASVQWVPNGSGEERQHITARHRGPIAIREEPMETDTNPHPSTEWPTTQPEWCLALTRGTTTWKNAKLGSRIRKKPSESVIGSDWGGTRGLASRGQGKHWASTEDSS